MFILGRFINRTGGDRVQKGLSCIAFENLPCLFVNTNLIEVLIENRTNTQHHLRPGMPY